MQRSKSGQSTQSKLDAEQTAADRNRYCMRSVRSAKLPYHVSRMLIDRPHFNAQGLTNLVSRLASSHHGQDLTLSFREIGILD